MIAALIWLLAQQFGFCFYNPTTGRWLNHDPIGEAGGANLYEAFYNNPLTYADRNGLDNWGNPGAGQNAPPVIVYTPSLRPGQTPIRPDNRDRDRSAFSTTWP